MLNVVGPYQGAIYWVTGCRQTLNGSLALWQKYKHKKYERNCSKMDSCLPFSASKMFSLLPFTSFDIIQHYGAMVHRSTSNFRVFVNSINCNLVQLGKICLALGDLTVVTKGTQLFRSGFDHTFYQWLQGQGASKHL